MNTKRKQRPSDASRQLSGRVVSSTSSNTLTAYERRTPQTNRPTKQAKIEQRALRVLNTFENAGKSVSRVTIEGRKIEIVLRDKQDVDEFDRIDMRYGKT